MEYRNVEQRNNIYYYPNDSFNTIVIRLNFMASDENDKAPIYDLLCEYLTKSNQVYKSDDDIIQRGQELYSLELSYSNESYGGQKVFLLQSNIISPNVLQEDYSKEAFEFIRDITKKPDFTNQEMLNVVKRNVLANYRLDIADNDSYSDYMYDQMVLPDERRKFENSVDMDYITQMIQSVTLEDLEREYNHLMRNFHSGFMFGNASKEQFDYFVDCMSLTPKEKDVSYRRDIATKEGDIAIEKDMEQSYIYATYDIDELSYPQVLVLHYMFNSSIGICFDTLREKYGLVYASSVDIMYHMNKIKIVAQTDKNKKKKFLEALDEIIDDLNDSEKLEQLMETAKKEFLASEYTFDEEQSRIVNAINAYLLNLHNGLDRNEEVEAVRNLTGEELLQKTKTMKRKNVFMVRSKEYE